MRDSHCQSDGYWNCFKGNIGETSERQDGAHVYWLFRVYRYTILNWTELNIQGFTMYNELYSHGSVHLKFAHTQINDTFLIIISTAIYFSKFNHLSLTSKVQNTSKKRKLCFIVNSPFHVCGAQCWFRSGCVGGGGGGEESKQKQNLVVNDRPKSKVSILVHSNVRILQSYLHLVLEWSWNGP